MLCHHSVCIQVTYIGNTTLKHGADYGEPPLGTVVLGAGEQISSVFGTSEILIYSIGFTTSWGTVYGPWGGPTGYGFSIDGPVYGFYGGMANEILGSIGTWTTDPLPAANPIPVPNPDGMMRSKMFGGT
jgi:hypothetical protein